MRLSANQKRVELFNLLGRITSPMLGLSALTEHSVPAKFLSEIKWRDVVRHLQAQVLLKHFPRNLRTANRVLQLEGLARSYYDRPISKFIQYAAYVWENTEREAMHSPIPGTIAAKPTKKRSIKKSFVPDRGSQRDEPSDSIGNALVDVFYATNRNRDGGPNVNKMYGSECNKSLQYGKAVVSIPHDHIRGQIERPSVFRFELKENARKHIVLRRIDELDKDDFFADLRRRRKEIVKGKLGTAFVFVHGYNVSFAEGARRCAQISYDMFLRTKSGNGAILSCVPILFSWPSRGSTLPYLHDGRNAEVSAVLFQEFLIDLSKKTGATDIVVLAHSMGSRPVIAALEKIGLGKLLQPKNRLREMILAAPDVDRDLFVNAAKQVMKAVSRTTLYASATDKALAGSKILNGFARLGDAEGGICTVKGMDSVDATSAGEDVLGHSNFATSKVMLDIYDIIVNRKVASQRTFSLAPIGNPPAYWQIRP